ncbi:hypothetical protein RCH16_003515 [Cryobacterium sp. MP_M5]|nr:hypothetical protein [Cryobacterium sp. MP_M3]MEC5178476.1 hypothetical protein [Cryobacterium sp. MP_M5]
MQTLLGDVTSALAGAWNIPAETVRQSPLVAVSDNYDKLGFAPQAVTRDQRPETRDQRPETRDQRYLH